MQKKMVRYAPSVGSELKLTFNLPDQYAIINVEFFDLKQRDILLHLDIRFTKGLLVFNQRHDFKWAEEIYHDIEYQSGKLYNLIFSFNENGLLISLKNDQAVYSFSWENINIQNINWLSYTHQTLNYPGFDSSIYGLLRLSTFIGITVQPKQMQYRELIERKQRQLGISLIIDANQDFKNVRDFIEHVYLKFDEIIILLSEYTLSYISEIRSLQSRYFNVIYYITDYHFRDAETLKKTFSTQALYNFALAKTSFQNIMFWHFACPLSYANINQWVKQYNLALRQDVFAVWLPTAIDFILLACSAADNIAFLPQDMAKTDHNETTAKELTLGVKLADLYLYKAYLQQVEGLDNVSLELLNQWSEYYAKELCYLPRVSVEESANFNRLLFRQLQLKHYKIAAEWQPQPLPKLVILIISCEQNQAKADAIRATWVKTAKAANISYLFIMGHPHRTARIEDDVLYVNAPDTYEFLGLKVQQALEYIVKQTDYEFIFKIDDDCILNVHALLRIRFEDFDYLGTAINRGTDSVGDWHYRSCRNAQLQQVLIALDKEMTWYDGQGGYLLSRKAAQLIVEHPTQLQQSLLEDYGVGLILRQHQIYADYVIPDFQSKRLSDVGEKLYATFAILSDIADAEAIVALWDILRQDEFTLRLKRELAENFYWPENS